jgi:uncharacterized phage protein (TIGR02218 family)
MTDARLTQEAVLVLYSQPAVAVRLTQAATLALYSAPADAVRLTQSALLALAQNVESLTHWAQAWRIERTDGPVFLYTDHDEALIFRGETYLPCESLSGSAIELSSLRDGAGNQEIKGIISDDAISEKDIAANLFDGAQVEVWMVPWSNAGGEVPYRVISGTIGKVEWGLAGYVLEVLTPLTILSQRALLQTVTPACSWDLGDDRCTVDLAALEVTGAVTAVAAKNASNQADRRDFTDAARAEADDYFALGTLTFTTGANADQSAEIKSFKAGRFMLWKPMLYPVAVGDAYKARPGCDLSAATCKAKFNNLINFGGFDDVPGRDALLQTPDSKS